MGEVILSRGFGCRCAVWHRVMGFTLMSKTRPFRTAVRAAKVLAAFVILGGTVGAFATLLLFVEIQFASHPPRLDAYFLSDLGRSVIMFPLISLYGAFFGAPAAIATGLIYLFGPRALRTAWWMLLLGSVLSAIWGAAIVLGMMPTAAASSYWGIAGLFAFAGAVAAPASRWLVLRWKLDD